MKHLFSLWVVATALLVFCNGASAITRYVASGGGPMEQNGSSWANALPTITAALQVSVSGDRVNVWGDANSAPNIFHERIYVPAGVAVYGGYGQGFGGRIIRNPVTFKTTIDGGHAGSVVRFASGGGPDTVLDGFDITAGTGTRFIITLTLFYYAGGGILCHDASPTLRSLTIHDNTANVGAGIDLESSDAIVERCTFSHNVATGSGGGMNAFYGVPTIRGCVFDQNTGAPGGGLKLLLSNATVADCLFTSNTADDGSAISLDESSATLANLTVYGNTASNTHGGSIDSRYLAHPTIVNCIVSGNNTGVHTDTDAMPASFRNNCVRFNTRFNYEGFPNPFGSNGNITVDPLFVSAPTNLRLQITSPCLDIGTESMLPWGSDLDNTARVKGCTIDMGAYEVTPPEPGVIHVKVGGSSAGDGFTWATAKGTVQEGVDTAFSRTLKEVWVAAGTYLEHISLPGGVAMYGGFDGTETCLGRRNPSVNTTVLDAGGSNYGIVVASNAGRNTIIDGFTIQHAAMDASSHGGGGIVCSTNASPTINGNVIANNTRGDSGGGGIYVIQGGPLITNNNIHHNTSARNGGGILVECNANPNIAAQVSDNQITDNITNGLYTNAGGAGIYIVGAGTYDGNNQRTTTSTIVVQRNTFARNDAQGATHNYNMGGFGGGLALYMGAGYIVDNTFSANKALYGGGLCGLFLQNPVAANTLCYRNVFSNNNAVTNDYTTGFGGAIYLFKVDAGALEISANRIDGNSANYGGAIEMDYSGATIASNTMTRNYADVMYGGLYMVSGSPLIVNNTICANSNRTNGNGASGIAISGVSSPTVVNNIVTNNVSGMFFAGGTPTPIFKNNCVWHNATNYSGFSPGNTDFSQDPRLANPFDDVHITAGSRCRNAGASYYIAALLYPYDVDGSLRVIGPQVDVGASELPAFRAYTAGDVAQVLRIAGGLEERYGLYELDLVITGASTGRLDVADAVAILRKVSGLGSNP